MPNTLSNQTGKTGILPAGMPDKAHKLSPAEAPPVFMPKINPIIAVSLVCICFFFLLDSSCRKSDPITPQPRDTVAHFVLRGLAGLPVANIRASNNYYYACLQKNGIYRIAKSYIDNGAWQYIGLKTNERASAGVFDVAIVGDHDEVILAGIWNVDSLLAGLMRSTDQGKTWVRSDSNLLGNGYFGQNVYSISTLLSYPPAPGVVFAINSYGSIIYWSHDSGKTWANTGNTGNVHGVMTWVSMERLRPERIWAGGEWGPSFVLLERSTDSGKTWPFVGFIDKRSTNRIYNIDFGKIGEIYAPCLDGVLKSTDDGLTWENIFTPDSIQYPVFVTVDPQNTNHVFLAIGVLNSLINDSLSNDTQIYEYVNGKCNHTYIIDNVELTHPLQVLNGRLFLPTLNGLYEGINILK